MDNKNPTLNKVTKKNKIRRAITICVGQTRCKNMFFIMKIFSYTSHTPGLY